MSSLYCAGSNSHGQLGINSLEDSTTFTLSNLHDSVQELVFGSTHTLALMENLELFGTGCNARGQLGPGPATNRLAFERIHLVELLDGLAEVERKELVKRNLQIVQVAAMWETSFVLLSGKDQGSDVLLSFGANDWGERGCNSKNGALVHLVDFSHLSPTTESIIRISNISAGPRHIIATIQIDNNPLQLVGWGAARHGQHGVSTTSPPSRIIHLPLPLSLSLPIQSTNIQYSLGRDHTALLFDSHLTTLGSNKQSQLGPATSSSTGSLDTNLISNPKEENQIQSVQSSWTGTYLQYENSIYGCGSNNHCQLALSGISSSSTFLPIALPPNSRSIKLSCGSEHMLVLVEIAGSKKVLGWGWNEHGNLGNGSLVDVSEPLLLSTGTRKDSTPRNIWAGNATSWIQQ